MNIYPSEKHLYTFLANRPTDKIDLLGLDEGMFITYANCEAMTDTYMSQYVVEPWTSEGWSCNCHRKESDVFTHKVEETPEKLLGLTSRKISGPDKDNKCVFEVKIGWSWTPESVLEQCWGSGDCSCEKECEKPFVFHIYNVLIREIIWPGEQSRWDKLRITVPCDFSIKDFIFPS